MCNTKYLLEVNFVLDEQKAKALAKAIRRLNSISFCQQIADSEREAQDMQKAADLLQKVLEQGGMK
ncbi:MAG: hypothetical protein L3J67_12545 [Hyphomicrobiaceae bacterium]|nr:hypothetical protein [Hyphomicrobiaceae bacterium]